MIGDTLPPVKLTQGLNMQPSGVTGGLPVASGGGAGLESGRCCRICLEEEDPSDQGENPFITPCGCQGSTKFIHVDCIRGWLDVKK